MYKPQTEFWQSVYPNGMTDEDITKELADLEFVANQLSKVYMHVTGQQASKPMIYAEVINGLHDDFLTDVVARENKQLLHEVLDFIKSNRPGYRMVRTTFDRDLVLSTETELVKQIKDRFEGYLNV